MIPLQLSIEGLYSYRKRQVIDFRSLTEAGLFGIFGQVGSGKSSVLEAITYALYGETERLNSKDKRAYNMMNLKSNRAYIEFDFINSENKKFRATRELKRNSKRFEDVKSQSVVFYEEMNGNWVPLGHSDAEKIIGLSYDNFKRTIIIPQGQFREFLELGASDRTRMMKEIFNLHQYDLHDKSAVLAKKNQSELDVLQGKLSGFEEVSEEIIGALKDQAAQEKEQLAEIQKKYDSVNETFQRLKALKTDFENLKLKKSDFEKLQSQKEETDRKRQQLEYYERIYKAFHQLLTDEKRLQDETDSKIKEQRYQAEELQKFQEHFKKTEAEIEKIRPDFEKLSQKKLEENDLELIAQILGFEKEITTLKTRTSKGESEVEKVADITLQLENLIKNTEAEIQDSGKKRTDPKLLMEIGDWFATQKSLSGMRERQLGKIQAQKQKSAEISEKLLALKISEDSFETDFARKTRQLETDKKHWENLCSQLEVRQKLAHYAHNLHDGEKCPLCGSTEHPEIAETEDVTANLQHARSEAERIEACRKDLQEKLGETKNLISQKGIFENQLKEEQQQYQQLELQINEHEKAFVWPDFSIGKPEEFEEKKAASLQIEKEIEEKNRFVAGKRTELEHERKKLEEYKKHLERFKMEEAQKETQVLQNKALLKALDFELYEKESEESIRRQLSDLKEENSRLEQNFNRLTQEINELNPKLASRKTSLQILEKQIENLGKEAENIQGNIRKTLADQQLESVETVREILALPLDVQAVRRETENFIIAFETLKNSISELETKLKDVSFDENIYQAEEEKLGLITAELKSATEKLTKTLAETERLTRAFETKKDLLEQQSRLQKRAENLKVLGNLFKGAGFVQYVSSIYLRQLCDNANVRFHRMTRNQLSLQLNENNDFEIIDYLNEGKSRSVKTLSGGQAFQVSLSLALALAESVQSHAEADKNFFFIDEGFGTQDQESVNIVFETLSNLQKENRIVGIISHVEELKERIPVSLNIVKDEEKGSLIELI